MYFLIDECLPLSLARLLKARGHAVSRVIEVRWLGRQAPDNEVYRFACENQATIITCNRADFRDLFEGSHARTCVLVVPQVPSKELNEIIAAFLDNVGDQLDPADGCWFWEVGVDGSTQQRDG